MGRHRVKRWRLVVTVKKEAENSGEDSGVRSVGRATVDCGLRELATALQLLLARPSATEVL
jgi:hypothetical protein